MCLQLLALVTDGCCMRGRCTSSTSLTGVIIYARGPLSVHIKRCLAGVTGVGLATTNQDRFKSPRDVVYCLACSTSIVASFTRSKLNSLDLNLSRDRLLTLPFIQGSKHIIIRPFSTVKEWCCPSVCPSVYLSVWKTGRRVLSVKFRPLSPEWKVVETSSVVKIYFLFPCN